MDAAAEFSYTAHVVTLTFTLSLMGILLTSLADGLPGYFGFLRNIEISPDLILEQADQQRRQPSSCAGG